MSTADKNTHPMQALTDAPVVSVILTTYNRCGFLQKAVESVLAQTYPAFELIVVDDGSTDGTRQILSAYAGRLKLICQSNRGVSAARNTGIRAADGQLIAFLDSDDYWMPQKLEHQVRYFNDHPRTLLCQTEELWIRNGIRVNPKKRHQKQAGLIFEKSLYLCLISPSAVMLRPSLLDEVGLFDESLTACEDYDLWLRVTWKYPVDLIPAPLTVKRGGHADQLSRRPELDKYRIQALVKILEQGCLSASQTSAAVTVLKKKCRIYAGGCRKRGRIRESEHYLNLSKKYHH